MLRASTAMLAIITTVAVGFGCVYFAHYLKSLEITQVETVAEILEGGVDTASGNSSDFRAGSFGT